MSTFHLKVVTPEKMILDTMVSQVIIPTEEGELGILPHHTNLMARLKPGEMRISSANKNEAMVVGSGFLQMAENQLVVMTDLAQTPSEIDEKAVMEAKKRAEEALSQKLSSAEHVEIISVLEKSMAQLKVKHRHRNRI